MDISINDSDILTSVRVKRDFTEDNNKNNNILVEKGLGNEKDTGFFKYK